MDNKLREKLQEINPDNLTGSATFSIGSNGIQKIVSEDMDVYELTLLLIEIQKVIIQKCADKNIDADELFIIVKGSTTIALEDLALEKMRQMLGDDVMSVLSKLPKNN